MTRFDLTMRIYAIHDALDHVYGIGEERPTQLTENATIAALFHTLADDLGLPKETHD